MMGQQVGSQDRLFYSFNLDDHVPRSHLLRGIGRFFDLGGLSEILCLGHNMLPRSMYATQDEDQPSRRP